jgi:hypothetical protein
MWAWAAIVPNPCSSLQTPENARAKESKKLNSGCSESQPNKDEPEAKFLNAKKRTVKSKKEGNNKRFTTSINNIRDY